MFGLLRTFFPWLRNDQGALHAADTFIPSSSYKHRFATVRGRRIVQDIPYLIPKDGEDANRLNFQHYMLKFALKGLYAASLNAPDTILDVATGTGLWAIEMAHIFPQATVTGFDIIPPPVDDAAEQTTYNPGVRPANYVFQQGNMFDGLPFPDNSFDFVHMRLVYGGTPVEKWLPLITELVRVTKPKGSIELVEGFILIDTGPNTTAIVNAINEAGRRRSIDPTYGKNIGSLLTQVGMKELKTRTVFIPIGKKHGRIGTLGELDTMSVFKAIGANVVSANIMTAEDWNRLYSQMPGEFDETQTLWPVFQAVGKKPVGVSRRAM